MTPIKDKAFLKKVKDISISSSLAVLVLSSGFYSCSSGSESDYQYEQTEVYTKGVKTYIKEVAKGEFKITDEIEVPAENSEAIVTYLDGHTETLTPKQASELIDNDLKYNESQVGHNSGLSNVLLYGGLGYFMGRTMRPNYGSYRPDFNSSPNGNVPKGGVSSTSQMGNFYDKPDTYAKATGVNSAVSRSRTTVSRPSSGRSGFFGGRSRSGTGG